MITKILKLFKPKTDEEKRNKLVCTVASLEKRVETLWFFERAGGYLFGMRHEILNAEKSLALAKKKLELLEQKLK